MNRRTLLSGLALASIFAAAGPASAYYNPRLGRFIQRDPTGYPDGMNAYEARRSNPVAALDPSGTEVRVKCAKAEGFGPLVAELDQLLEAYGVGGSGAHYDATTR